MPGERIDVLIVTAALGEDDAVRGVHEGAIGPWRETDGPPGYGFKVWRCELALQRARLSRDKRAPTQARTLVEQCAYNRCDSELADTEAADAWPDTPPQRGRSQ